MDSNNLGEPLQSAYRCAHNTETALLAVQDTFLRAIDKQEAVFLVMIDMSAAFDTVDHAILLQRLIDDFGICDTAHLWFKSYLNNRSSQVCVKGSVSTETQIKHGVPQGSVIGPQIFTYYSHIIGHIIRQHSIQYHIYADDVQLFMSFNPSTPGDSACALFKLAQCVKELEAWMVSNKLMMNPEKTEFFIASSPAHYKRLQHLTFHLDDLEIHPSPTVKNLGAVFDHDMKMSDHITQLCRSLNYQIRNLNRIRRFLDFDACNNAIRSLIISKLDYCSALLNGLSQKNIGRLQRIQNRCARLIFKKPKLTHTSPLLAELHWLPVAKRIKFRTLVHTYKILNNLSPSYLSSLLQVKKSSTHFLRSSNACRLYVPRSRILAGDRAFSIAAPRLWNGLPSTARNSTTIVSFKKALKTHLFSS